MRGKREISIDVELRSPVVTANDSRERDIDDDVISSLLEEEKESEKGGRNVEGKEKRENSQEMMTWMEMTCPRMR